MTVAMIAVAVLLLAGLILSIKVVKPHERMMVFHFGKPTDLRQQGIHVLLPLIYDVQKIDLNLVMSGWVVMKKEEIDAKSRDLAITAYLNRV